MITQSVQLQINKIMNASQPTDDLKTNFENHNEYELDVQLKNYEETKNQIDDLMKFVECQATEIFSYIKRNNLADVRFKQN